MGANTSKQDARGAYEWKASGPPSVSLDVLESLQSSPETDASRARLVERHIQARVADELQRLQQREAEILRRTHESAVAADDAGAKDTPGPGRFALSDEVEQLRRKLDERQQVRALPDSVESARGELIRCLRENDRRPLDCWREVDNFKAEVKKLEKLWVDKVAS